MVLEFQRNFRDIHSFFLLQKYLKVSWKNDNILFLVKPPDIYLSKFWNFEMFMSVLIVKCIYLNCPMYLSWLWHVVVLKVSHPMVTQPSLPYKPILWLSSPQVCSYLMITVVMSMMIIFIALHPHNLPLTLEKSWSYGVLLVKTIDWQVSIWLGNIVPTIPECDIRMDFDTNEYPNIFVSRKITLTNIRIYSYEFFDTNDYPNKYSDQKYSNIRIYSSHSGLDWHQFCAFTI